MFINEQLFDKITMGEEIWKLSCSP